MFGRMFGYRGTPFIRDGERDTVQSKQCWLNSASVKQNELPRPTQTSAMLSPFTIWSSINKISKTFIVLVHFIEHPSLLAKHLFRSVDLYLFTYDSILTSTDDAFHHVTTLKLRRCMFGSLVKKYDR